MHGGLDWNGDPFAGYGTVFKITTNGSLVWSFLFDGDNGSWPFWLAEGKDGDFFGTAQAGGAYGAGTVFRITADGDFTNLFSFNGTNGFAGTGILLGADGNLYGATLRGGTDYGDSQTLGSGTVFKMSTDGRLLWSHSFDGTNAGGPNLLVQGPDLNLYGSCQEGSLGGGAGCLFRATPDGSVNILFSFGLTNGDSPQFSPIFGNDGDLYGTTAFGGTNDMAMGRGDGTVYRLSIPMAPGLQTPVQTGATVHVTWSSVSGQMYQLQELTNAVRTDWLNVGNAQVATNGTMSAFEAWNPAELRLYRVILLP